MKKMFLALMLLAGIFCCVQVSAGAKEDFDAYVAACQRNITGGKVIGDFTNRVIYISWPLKAQSSQIDRSKTSEIKQGMLKMIKKYPQEVQILKRLNIILVYCYISLDRQIYSIALSPNEL